MLRQLRRGSGRKMVVDLGASRVAGGIFTRTAVGALRLERYAVEPLVRDGTRPENWMEETERALVSLAGAMGERAGELTLGVPGHLALTKFVKTPAIAAAKRVRIIWFEASQNIPYPLNEVVWDHVAVSDDEREIEVMLAAAKREAMHALCDAADRSRLSVAQAIPSCVALERGFRYNHPNATERVLLLNIGARSTHVVLTEPGRFSVRTLALGGDAVTHTIADELRIDFAAAEALKRRNVIRGSAAAEELSTAAAVHRAEEAFALRLQAEITRSLLNSGRNGAANTPVRIFLAGGGASSERLPARVAAKFGVPVERYDPFRRVELSPAIDATSVRADAPRLAELVGLASCAFGLAGRARVPNLLPIEWVAARAFQRRRPLWLGTAAAVAVGLLPLIHQSQRAVENAARRTTEIETRLQPLRATAAQRAAELAERVRTREQIEALRRVAAARASWSEFLADLQSRFAEVGDAWLEELSIVPAKRDLAENGDSPALRLRVSGCLLDGMDDANAFDRAKRLLASVGASPFIAAVEDERFDGGRAGVLRFDFTLLANAEKRL